ncbi:MAG: zinc transporter ZupT [Acidobacteriota bacterium]|nr:zinc transporter ZupT [Acidobacteriota bacterium]
MTPVAGLTLAFVLTLFAGLATGVGGIIATLARAGNHRFLSFSLGLSAGVMIYVSMMEMMPQANQRLVEQFGDKQGAWVSVAAFFGGIVFTGVIDRLVPEQVNPHEADLTPHAMAARNQSLQRTGLVTAAAVALHNFPEGFATFISALEDLQLGIPIAVAVGIHNIPEGIAVAVPIHQASGSRRKGILAAWLSGLAEPIGAMIGYLLLRPFLTEATVGITFGVVAGIMVFISFDELLPTAEEYGEHHLTIYGLIAGMAVMALSLLLLM